MNILQKKISDTTWCVQLIMVLTALGAAYGAQPLLVSVPKDEWNGESRQVLACILGILVGFAFGRRAVGRRDRFAGLVSVLLIAGSAVLATLAQKVRYKCEGPTGYFPGCGDRPIMWVGTFAGVAVAALCLGIVLRTRWQLRWMALFGAVAGLYYADYMTHFWHRFYAVREVVFIFDAALVVLGMMWATVWLAMWCWRKLHLVVPVSAVIARLP